MQFLTHLVFVNPHIWFCPIYIAAKAGDAHRFLIKKVYPALRRTEYTVYYVYKKEVNP